MSDIKPSTKPWALSRAFGKFGFSDSDVRVCNTVRIFYDLAMFLVDSLTQTYRQEGRIIYILLIGKM